MEINLEKYKSPHKTWHKFYKWMVKNFGEGLHGEVEITKIPQGKGKRPKVYKSRSFNEYELSKRLVGYEVMEKMEKYIKRNCPEIKIVWCDDEHYASSMILLIPHPTHGITMMFIPQCTSIQNQWFLYGSHYEMLMKALAEMKDVYVEDETYGI